MPMQLIRQLMIKAQQQLDELENILATPVSLKVEKHTAPHFESLTGHDNFIASIEKVKSTSVPEM